MSTHDKQAELMRIGDAHMKSIAEMVEALDGEYPEEAMLRIQEDPLSVEVSGTWAWGDVPESDTFVVLLSTGGPACRIVAKHDTKVITDAWMEVQDWFTPWTRVPSNEPVLLRYMDALGLDPGDYYAR